MSVVEKLSEVRVEFAALDDDDDGDFIADVTTETSSDLQQETYTFISFCKLIESWQ